jgi:uncharacterized membrane protein YoaK (UPF0700 family)
VLGQVFASAMTGNTALLGIAISEGNLLAASKPFTPLFGFVIGAAFASAIYSPGVPATRQPVVLRTLLLIEIGCLGAFAIIWQMADNPTKGVTLYGLILLCSIGMGIQGIAAKNINVPGVSTIVFTSTLAGIVLSVTEILLRRRSGVDFRSATKVQVAIFGAYGAGAVLAGLLDRNEFALLTCMPVAAVIFALGCFELRRGHSIGT